MVSVSSIDSTSSDMDLYFLSVERESRRGKLLPRIAVACLLS